MKHLAVFCDGTWNDRDRTDHPTTVARLASLLQDAPPAGVVAFYDAGVGAPEPDTPGGVAGWWYRLRGGALGDGLTRNIADCYRFLIETYAPGDRIHVFGFSRGAYTARSLGGLLRNCGLPEDPAHLPEALAWYRSRDAASHPGTEASRALRARLSPRVHTSAAERAWRAARGLPEGVPLDLGYIGVFDTVGAHGLGGVLGQFRRGVPGGHGFHDHDLSSLVRAGRHAIALDEARVLYRPTRWTNLAQLNAAAGPDAEGGARYRQAWFPGTHGTVGGSGPERRLANRAAAWIVAGARAAGLPIDTAGDPALALTETDHLGPLEIPVPGRDPSGWVNWARRGPGPDEVAALHAVARRRLADDPTYRPASLRHALLDQRTYALLTGAATRRA